MSTSAQESAINLHGAKASSGMDADGAAFWQRRCQELIAEQGELQKELAQIKEDRDAYLRAVKLLLPEKEYSYSKEELLSQVGVLPPLENLISELERGIGK